MPIDGTKPLGDWGKLIPVNDNVHITQTNAISDEGKGAHVTTNIPGERIKVRDYFDANGNFDRTNFAKR